MRSGLLNTPLIWEIYSVEKMFVQRTHVNIRITRDGATAEQKAELIRGVTSLLVKVLGKNPETTVITIDEIETDNWGIGGETVAVRRKRDKAGG